MIRWLRQHFAPMLYVQIWERRLKITECATGKVYDDVPLMALQILASGQKNILAIGKEAARIADANVVTINPFSHPRTLLADFYVAEKSCSMLFRPLPVIGFYGSGRKRFSSRWRKPRVDSMRLNAERSESSPWVPGPSR